MGAGEVTAHDRLMAIAGGVARTRTLVSAQQCQRGINFRDSGTCAAKTTQINFSKMIKSLTLSRSTQQALVCVLPVHIEQILSKIGQLGNGSQTTIDVST